MVHCLNYYLDYNRNLIGLGVGNNVEFKPQLVLIILCYVRALFSAFIFPVKTNHVQKSSKCYGIL